METTDKKGAERSLEAEEIIKRLILCNDPKDIWEDIRYVLDFYLTKTDDAADGRECIYCSFLSIEHVLKEAQPFYDKKYPNKE